MPCVHRELPAQQRIPKRTRADSKSHAETRFAPTLFPPLFPPKPGSVPRERFPVRSVARLESPDTQNAAGPTLDPERPADRLDAVRETDESRPVRRARRAQPPAGSAHPPGASPPRPGCSAETPGSNLRATAVARTPELDRRLAVLTEDNELCLSSRAPPGLRRRAAGRSGSSARRSVSRWLRPLTVKPVEADRPSKREVEPAREKRERVAASLREDPLPHALVERPFVPILPRSCCWPGRKAPSRALLHDRESLSKGRGAPVNLSSCCPVLSSRTYVDVSTVVHFNASAFTRTGTSR